MRTRSSHRDGLSRGIEYSDDTMNKQRSRARSSELGERDLIGILIAVPRRTYRVFARDLKRLQREKLPCLPSPAASLSHPALLRATKHYKTPSPGRAVLESPKYSLEYSDTSDTRSNVGYLGKVARKHRREQANESSKIIAVGDTKDRENTRIYKTWTGRTNCSLISSGTHRAVTASTCVCLHRVPCTLFWIHELLRSPS